MPLISIPNNPCPPFVTDGFFKTKDGVKLRFARWIENDGAARGTVCILTGRGEFVEKYYEVIGELRRRKFCVAIFDWRGQGGSDRSLRNSEKGYVTTFKKYDIDLQDFMKQIVLPYCPPPFIAIGHSMGGAILLRNLVRQDTFFSRSVLTAPMIGICGMDSSSKQKLTKIVIELLCLFGLGRLNIPGKNRKNSQMEKFENNNFTSDFIRWKRTKDVLEEAPHLKIGPPTLGWTKAAFRALTQIQTSYFAQRINIPVLLFTAGSDTIVSSVWSEKFSNMMKHSTFIYLSGSLHEILQERDPVRQRFWSAFDAYMGI